VWLAPFAALIALFPRRTVDALGLEGSKFPGVA
jgi:hypothetical protein